MVGEIDQSRWVDKYERRATVARVDYEAGVKKPKRNPIEAAIAAKETMVAKLTEVLAGTKWEDALRFVGEEGWRTAALKKGAPRYPEGIRAGLNKVKDFVGKFAPHLEAGMADVEKMPKRTLEESIEKAAAMIRHNAAFTYKKR